MSKRAVFLDKDGTLVVDVPYNVDPSRLRLMPGSIEGLKRLHNAGFSLVVVSNQSGVARGYFDETAVDALFARLSAILRDEGVPLLGCYYCPHHVDGFVSQYCRACDCRKPASGLLRRATLEHDLDLQASFLVGDILDDIEAGKRAGCRTVLISNGGETEWRLTPGRVPDYTAPDLSNAADIIISLASQKMAPTATGGVSYGR